MNDNFAEMVLDKQTHTLFPHVISRIHHCA